MTSPPQEFAVGLQPERTLLAWRRTALSLGAACLAGARLAFDRYGAGAAVIGVIGLALAGATYVAANRRYRRILQPRPGTDPFPPAGLVASLLTVTTLTVGLLSVLYVM